MGFFNNSGIGGAGGGSTPTTGDYTNATPLSVTLGGHFVGDTFAAVPYDTMWTKLLYPYQSPTFSAFTISGQTSPIEVGDVITSGAKTFTWSTTNSANITANTIEIIDVTNANTVLLTGLANDGNEAYNLVAPIQKTTQANHVFQIKATNTNAINFTRNYTVNWYFRFYWGFLPQTTLADADILTLASSKLTTTFAGTITLPANGGTNYDFICYPDSFGAINSIFDNTNSFLVTGDYIDQGILAHTNAFGIVENYRVYRSVNPSAGKSGWSYTIS